ncbi:MAG: threonine/serine exporter [Treponema sp.]|jgi:uncharacterized membrane protein YjjB (DUF3815 family)|nr:threonine/serine exporter [Treponema sp.]
MQTVLWTSFWAALASAFCAIVFNAGKYDILPGAIAGGIGWFFYKFLFVYLKIAEPIGFMCGAAALTLFSEIWAYVGKKPATVCLLPGLFPLVPGYSMFVAVHAVVTHNAELAGKAGYSALIAAGSIALGMAVAASTARLFIMVKKHKKPENSKLPDKI